MLTRKPRLLDLFCGAGGAAMGYHRAGFDVVGVDIKPQPRYPFEFVQQDAIWVLRELVSAPSVSFAAIHASPPCQAYSRLRYLPWLRDRKYPALIEITRNLLQQVGVPWVIENVEDAPLLRALSLFGGSGVMLCGQMFGLEGQYRHRLFESSIILTPLPHPRHTFVMAPGSASLSKRYPRRVAGIGAWQKAGGIAGHFGNREQAERSMGIDWMKVDELREAIPPAMTQFIGEQLIEHLTRAENLAHS